MTDQNLPAEDALEAVEQKTTDEKLQKVLARAGVGSRREMERWIVAGRVTINKEKAQLGDRVTWRDRISVDGKPLDIVSPTNIERRVLIYNKPEGEIVTRSDPENRSTVFDKLPLRWFKSNSA